MQDAPLIRLWTDFNAQTPDEECWILVFDDRHLETDQHFAALALKSGDKVLLYQDDDDFTVSATLEKRFVSVLRRVAWVAMPDWATLKYK